MGEPIKHGFRVSPRWAFMEWADIPSYANPNEVYLRRLRVLQTPLFGIMLHFIFEPDTDPDPHDHPWVFWSLVLRGGYHERVFPYVVRDRHDFSSQEFRNGWLSFHKFPFDWAHKIIVLKPHTITLVITGRRRRNPWGFHTSEGFVPRKQYQEQRKMKARHSIDHEQLDPWEV